MKPVVVLLLIMATTATLVHGDTPTAPTWQPAVTPTSDPEVDCPQYCLDAFDPVGDEDDNTYANECYMKRAKCNGEKKNSKKLKWLKSDSASRESDVINNPSTKCSQGCPDVELPVCASNGVRYSNPCDLKRAVCEHPELNIIEDAGTGCPYETPKTTRMLSTFMALIAVLEKT